MSNQMNENLILIFIVSFTLAQPARLGGGGLGLLCN